MIYIKDYGNNEAYTGDSALTPYVCAFDAINKTLFASKDNGNKIKIGNSQDGIPIIIRYTTVDYIGGDSISYDINNIINSGSCPFISNSALSVYVGDEVTTISDNTFANCTTLTSVTFSPNVNIIGANAFSGCTSLTSVTIPNTVTTIGEYAFYSPKLSYVHISDATTISTVSFSKNGGNLYYTLIEGDEVSQNTLKAFAGWNLYLNNELVGKIIESSEQSGTYIVE